MRDGTWLQRTTTRDFESQRSTNEHAHHRFRRIQSADTKRRLLEAALDDSPQLLNRAYLNCAAIFRYLSLKNDIEEASKGYPRLPFDANHDGRTAEFRVDEARVSAMLPRDRPHHGKTQPGAAALT